MINYVQMKTIVFQTDKLRQFNLLIDLAKQLGIGVKLFDDIDENQLTAIVSEASFAEEWNSKEDQHWDEFLAQNSTKEV